ncbi:MAG TPA: response regulator [Candidatus Angelobacter sp.]|nr:response regulator [Candidatus Angelobacter sp.]
MSYLALVVDDSLVIRHVLRRFLEQRGFTVETVSDGAEALKLLETVRPHLIFTDLQMPRLDGHRFIKILKDNPKFSEIPLVVLAAKPLPGADAVSGTQFLIAKDMNIETQLKQILDELQPLLPSGSTQS